MPAKNLSGAHIPGSGANASELLNLNKEEAIQFPDISDLASRLRFTPSNGHIWLDDRRMVLMHTRALGVLRREMIEKLGQDGARAILTRTGYEAGAMDAEISNKVRSKGKLLEAFSVGPQLHALEGIVLVEQVKCDIDVEKSKFYAEYLWHHSFEDEIHIDEFGIGAEPVCWMQIGYASGYASTFFGRPIIYREVECRAMGHAHCRIIGKPAEEWDNPEVDLKYLRAENFSESKNVQKKQQPKNIIKTRSRYSDEIRKANIVGASAGFNAAYHKLKRVAKTNATVLFLGESGVGKGVFAKTLHQMSDRSDKLLVSVNCAAIPENLIEAELFGVEKGAYTGATESRPGRFERANGGTLFLDEIGTLTLSAQGKILRALQEGEIERIGDQKVRKVDVRVIAATNTNLRAAIQRQEFREDLFFRLNVFPIRIPPLRERKADLSLLLDRFVWLYSTRHNKNITGFSERAIAALLSYEWPGNIREMENLVERGVILADDGGAIDFQHIFTSDETFDISAFRLNETGFLDPSSSEMFGLEPNEAKENTSNSIQDFLDRGTPMRDIETQMVIEALKRTKGNRSAAARMLGISRAQILYRLSKIENKS